VIRCSSGAVEALAKLLSKLPANIPAAFFVVMHMGASEVQDREGRWYSLRIRRYCTTENKIDGAVILLVDIDEIKRGLDEFMTLVHQALMTLHGDLRVNHANEAFYKAFATTKKQTEEILIYDLCNGAWNCPALKNHLEGILPEKQLVENYKLEHDFGPLGRRCLLVSARRLVQRTKGTQLTLLAINDVTDRNFKDRKS
jgi:two-component system, chemotaxis family, CheB/CheR fusion protein